MTDKKASAEADGSPALTDDVVRISRETSPGVWANYRVPAQDIADLSGVKTTSITLTAAQILALYDTPIELVPAPGAGYGIWLQAGYIDFKHVTTPYQLPSGASRFNHLIGGVDIADNALDSELITAPASKTEASVIAQAPLPSATSNNGALQVKLNSKPGGPVTASAINAAGSGYAPGDTGGIEAGRVNPEYVVDTVDGGGAVLSYHLTNQGTACSPVTGALTYTLTGGGDGNFTVDITTANAVGDGTLRLSYLYSITPLQ